MITKIKQFFSKSNKDLRKKVWFTFAMLFIFKLGTAIVVPGVDDDLNVGFLELLNILGGGAMQNFSIFALGVMPYITATIVMQLLGELIPYFQELNKQGHVGRQKINTYSRYMGILFALLQGYAFSFMFLGRSASATEYIYISVVLTAGTAVPAIIAGAGVLTAATGVAKSAYKAHQAKTDAEAEAAWQSIGSGVTGIGLSVAGAKGSDILVLLENTGSSALIQNEYHSSFLLRFLY